MANLLTNLFREPDLRKRVLFTIWCLIIFRIGAHITTPGIDPARLKDMIENVMHSHKALGNLLSYIDLFSGGALKQFTIFALGVMPYISISIIMQLLMTVVPQLEQLGKEGEMGRRKIQQYTKYGTVIMCIIQSATISRWIASNEGVVVEGLKNHQFFFTVLVVVSITSGTMFLMWLGEQISERGIGNGISLLIFAGIAARIPGAFIRTLDLVKQGNFNPVAFILVLLIFSVIIFFVVYEQEGQRRIPVQFARKIVGRKVYGAQNTYIPFKINPSGVIPIIFASAIVMFPAQIASMLGNKFPAFTQLIAYLSPGQIPYMMIYGLLVIAFAYLYTTIQFNPVEIADNLKKSGGYIPGIRPGQHTQEYLQKILTRITLSGSLFLAFIAVFPDVILKIDMFSELDRGLAYLMGGTSLLILVSVDLDTMKQIESQLMMRNYDGFMSKGRRRK
ncbi:MAG: preprotein translocase subunit SecY [Spirochaetes bacterium GWF1_41_5]|nr:MAG: preprotein translocase subunit SecY [Spirochaetes bacterium GWF1_41_5]HBE03500.1 preprotein translocase subunit SecY [Spirochaetia bacterium]